MPDARGAIFGLTLDATGAHLARAALESIAYQTLDLIDAMAADGAPRAATIRVDGGMAANDWFCQFLADMLDAPVERPAELETTRARRGFPGRAGDRRMDRPESRRRRLPQRRRSSRPPCRRHAAMGSWPAGGPRFGARS